MNLKLTAPLSGLKGDPRYNYSYQRRQVIRAVVQISLPSAGLLIVRPVEGSLVVPYLVCTLTTVGGYLGTSVFNTIQPGQQVFVNMYAGSDRCTLLSPAPTNKDLRQASAVDMINDYSWSMPIYKSQMEKNIKQDIQHQVLNPFYNSNYIPQDVYAGDFVAGDKNGSNIFIGRTCLVLNGSAFSNIQLDAVNNKITQLYNEKQQIALNRYQKKSVDIDYKLKAMCVQQGVGKKLNSTKQIYQYKQQSDSGLIQAQITTPVFREAQVSGAAYRGTIKATFVPIGKQQLYTENSKIPATSSQHISYYGEKELRAQNITAIKTPYIKEARYTKNKEYQIQYTETVSTISGVDAPLIQDLYIQSDMYSLQQMTCMLQDDFYVFPDTLQSTMQWKQGQQQTAQNLAQSDYAFLQDQIAQKQVKIYKNTSFIKQAQDGSIFIKDGWGSQIRMTRGNIIISSALDTFIRPGRDLIQLVPRLKETTTNGPAVLASKQSIKIAAQTDVKIASAISGGTGSTVLENRTNNVNSPNSGVVIRSNADMTVTASKDLYIGLNDKSKQNAGQNVTKGTGTFILDVGDDFAINAKNSIKLTAGQIQIYGYNGNTGAGITINSTQIAASAMNVNVQGFIQAGTHSNGTAIQYNNEQSFTIRSGQSALYIDGPIQATSIAARDMLLSMNSVVGQQFATKASTQQQLIPTLTAQSRSSIQRAYGNMVQLNMSAITDVMSSAQISCYKDSFICDRQLKFNDSAILGFGQYSMPGMCWQQQTYKPKQSVIFQPVIAKQTGSDQQSKTYPGATMWQTASITTVQNQEINTSNKLSGFYKTNVIRKIQE